jgi:hypothetical protein
MPVIVKLVLVFTLVLVFYQDTRDRKVYWFAFPLIALCCGFLYYQHSLMELFYTSIIINLIFVGLLFMVIYLYSKFKLKTDFKNTFGFGDTLLFLALAFSFSSVSFITLFVFSLIFALVLHLLYKKRYKLKTVPLAGYMSLFFCLVYIAYWLGFVNQLYVI